MDSPLTVLDSDEEEADDGGRSSDVELIQGPTGGSGMDGVVEEVSDQGEKKREKEGGREGGGGGVSSRSGDEEATNERARRWSEGRGSFFSQSSEN